MRHNFKVFDKIGKNVSEWIKFFKEFNAKPVTEQVELGDIDCMIEEADSETDKAWVFDYTALYEKGKCSRRFYYAPKSQCKVLENDYYVDEDGSYHKGTFVLVPAWIDREIGY